MEKTSSTTQRFGVFALYRPTAVRFNGMSDGIRVARRAER
jgi:hypothetical protein